MDKEHLNMEGKLFVAPDIFDALESSGVKSFEGVMLIGIVYIIKDARLPERQVLGDPKIIDELKSKIECCERITYEEKGNDQA